MHTASVISLSVLTIIAGVTVWRIRRHPRRPSNGFWLLATVGALWYAVLALTSALMPVHAVSVPALIGTAPTLILPVLVIIAGLSLIANTGVVVRREGVRLATLTPAVIGVALLGTVGLAATALYVAAGDVTVLSWSARAAVNVAVLALIPGAMLIVELVAYTVYAVVYRWIPHRGDADLVDVIVVLGCGLVEGAVSPLLAARVGKAVAEYTSREDTGTPPLLVVMSGGQGADETRAEAEAMAEYARGRGIPGDRILMETQSTNTEENLLFTEEVLEDAGLVDPALLFVTSNFHVLRSVSLSRQLRLRVRALGSATPSYYLPSAFLREFAALVVHYRWANVLVWFTLTALWAVPLIFM
ncbi:YdcF family protein [Corynebacterium glyciniphilum]|uniref:YdcF family protein n=1 Tax=Corynebacterium glyciniphilum TaxID=1404244 RepID=UPI002653A619|nr:YdcF family protein [Corynebacterium glyciniphilum]MDN6707287.1 YdcF family protein [Corynebacterium glyciniphilum]